MGEVVEINQKRYFTLDEARALLPIVRRVTRHAAEHVQQLSAQFGYLDDPLRKKALEARVRAALEEWQSKINKLGCEAKGIWLVDFDNGEGYYCWHYPESELGFFHGYDQGFRGRKRLP